MLLQQEFSGEAGKRRLNRVAVQTKKDVDEAVKADLGDQSMSGWRRSKPINIKGRYDLVDDHPIARRQHAARRAAYRKVLGDDTPVHALDWRAP